MLFDRLLDIILDLILLNICCLTFLIHSVWKHCSVFFTLVMHAQMKRGDDLMTSEELLLTTKDNMYNPFTDYDDWRDYDCDANSPTHPPYCTEAYSMRLLGLRNPDDYSTEAISEELMSVYEEIITINKEIGNDIYILITPDGKKLEHVPPDLLFNTPRGV